MIRNILKNKVIKEELKRPISKVLGLIAIKDILNILINKESTPDILIINNLWFKTVGSKIAAQTKPVAIKGSSLLVYVSSSVWLHELMFSKKSIINKLNDLKKVVFISDINFKIGNI